MKPVILLTGKTGQIGAELLHCLLPLGEVVAPDRNQLDLSKPDDIRRTMREIRPRIVVNAAAYTAVDQAESDETLARAVNSEAPEVLATEARKIGAGMVHYSTDYVFDGTKKAPYDETDATNPLSVYGKTKFAGEQAIRGSGVSYLVFRTAWIYATQGRNFLLTILRLATEREELRIVSDQIGAPTCASDVAAATSEILAKICRRDDGEPVFSDVSGTYHMSASGQTTWYDFATSILNEARAVPSHPAWLTAATRGRELISRCVVPISTKEFRSLAQRPPYSVLSNSRLMHTFGVALPGWRAQLHRCFVSRSTAANCGAN